MSFKLYELTEMYQNIWELVADDETDLDTLEIALSQIEDNIELKAESMAKLVRGIDGDVAALKEEETRLAKRRKALENKQTNIKLFLENQLKQMGLDKVETPLFKVSIQNNPPSVNILDEDLIPEQYKKTVTTTSLVKNDILKALKEGQVIEGAELKQGKSLRIR